MIEAGEIYEGREFFGITVRDFQTINRLANDEGLMAKITFIDESPFGRTIDFTLVRMDDD